ncbi:hypothetical protein JTE90_028165 [Oedothorax gibbosus]|uniref:CRAL-TRIO domain-containing protein n=1 Tax=Oedothorax gibbosus TaxID=931172 RepID=A0AAV6VBG9_9ARAC|nr:hypothetical protein JTE90_028165 [Oedothorax gibbosus]
MPFRSSTPPVSDLSGVNIVPFEVGYLTPHFEKKAESENDTSETRTRCIQELKDVIIQEGDDTIRHIKFSDDFLLQHLRTRKFDVRRCLKSLTQFISLTLKFPEMFQNFCFDATSRGVRDGIVTFLPWRCQDGCIILYVQISNWHLEEFPMEEVKRMLVVMLTQAMRDPMTQVNGIKTIIDIKGFNFKHLKQCTPHNLWLLYHATQNCVPGRYKQIHIVNYHLLFLSVWLCVKQFMSKKLQDRVHFHTSPKKLFDFFPSECIPAKYGGQLVVEDQTEWLRKMMTPEELAYIGGGALNPI